MMPLLHSALRVPRALMGAIHRNGLRNVIAFGAGLLRKQGLFGAGRYAFLTAEQRRETAEATTRKLMDRGFAAPRPGYEPQIGDREADYGMPLALWRERMAKAKALRALHAQSHSYVETTASITLGVVLLPTPEATPEDMARTLDALARLDAGKLAEPVRVLSLDRDLILNWTPAGLRTVATTAELPGTPDAWILFLKVGDIVASDLLQTATPATALPISKVMTFDMVRVTGARAYPILLPGANPMLARHVDYCFSRMALRADIVLEDLANIDHPGALLSAWLDGLSSPDARLRWVHIFQPLVEFHADRLKVETLAPRATAAAVQDHRVSIVICTKDKGHLMRQLTRALIAADDDRIADLVIVSNNTTNPYALETLRALEGRTKVTVLRHDAPFNFSRLSNIGARAARGDFLLFLNDDIVPVSDNWLDVLLTPFALDPAVGVAGPLLIYPDERVQHAGMYLGYRGVAGHTLRFAQLPRDEYLYYASAPREVSALTGAAMLVSRPCFEALNGFDEMLATHLQDVDFSLRAKQSGFTNILQPHAILIHMESASIKPIVASDAMSRQRRLELEYFLARWGDFIGHDDLHNPGFDLHDETLRTLV